MKTVDDLYEIIKPLPKDLNAICAKALKAPKYAIAPGGKEHHHNYRGGLVQHVWEVTTNAINMTRGLPLESEWIVVVAGIWHDYCKIHEYQFVEKDGAEVVENLPYKKLIGHVAGSFAEFMFTANQVYDHEYPEIVDKIAHVLLSHHGRLEWRSPVEPQTPEAHIFHVADMMSMQGNNIAL